MEPSICRRHTSIVNMVVDLVYGGAGTLTHTDLVHNVHIWYQLSSLYVRRVTLQGGRMHCGRNAARRVCERERHPGTA